MTSLVTKTVAIAALLFVSDLHTFGINGRPVLCVPVSDMDRLLLPYTHESTHLRIGSGHTPGFGFWFSPETMRTAIPAYVVIPGFAGHHYANALSGSIGFLDRKDRMRLGPAMRARDVEDEWYARGKCPNPIATRLPQTAFYEIKCNARADYATIWNEAPNPRAPMPNANELVVATCNYTVPQLGPYKGETFKDCARVVVIDGFLVDYRFQEENARVIPQMDSVIRRKLMQWKKDCSTPA